MSFLIYIKCFEIGQTKFIAQNQESDKGTNYIVTPGKTVLANQFVPKYVGIIQIVGNHQNP